MGFFCVKGGEMVFANANNRKVHKALRNLVVACFLGEGDIFLHSGKSRIVFCFDRSKASFIKNFIVENNLEQAVEIDMNKQQFMIKEHPIVFDCYSKWYDGPHKIYYDKMVTYESIIISLILFGKRKLESLTFYTSFDKKYLPTVAYGLESRLGIPLVAARDSIKIYDTSQLFLDAIQRLGLIECTEIAHFLTSKESKVLSESIDKMSIIGGRLHEIS